MVAVAMAVAMYATHACTVMKTRWRGLKKEQAKITNYAQRAI